jgi:hypothetical protein
MKWTIGFVLGFIVLLLVAIGTTLANNGSPSAGLLIGAAWLGVALDILGFVTSLWCHCKREGEAGSGGGDEEGFGLTPHN